MASKLHVIVASTRPSRLGPSVARWFEGFARAHGWLDPVLVDLADFDLPVYDEPEHPLSGGTGTSTPSAGAKASRPRTPTLSSRRSTTTSRHPRS